MIIHGDINSGNCYKIKLLLELLGIQHKWKHVDILKGDTQTENFLTINPNGKIPALELPNGDSISESNAILNYLAEGTAFLPGDKWLRSKILQWQFFEQYSHEPYIAVARFINKYLGLPAEREDEYKSKQKGGHKALFVMEQQLARTSYLVGESYTIADISLYAYTHVAHEGGFDLSAYPGVCNWLARIATHPRHVTMQHFNV